MHIRPYAPTDQQAVLALLRLNTPGSFAPEEEDDLLHYLAAEIELYFVGETDGNVIACGGFNFAKDGTTASISWDIVHPAAQGKGAGTELLAFRIARIREFAAIKTIRVRTSQMAYRFYERSGFVLQSIEKDYWAPGFDLYLMEQPA